jgi:hypothetical protein
MGVDYIDYTYLQKRGLIKIKEQPAPSGMKVNKEGFLELSGSDPVYNSNEIVDSNNATNSNNSVSQPNTVNSGFVSFFDAPVSSASPFSPDYNSTPAVSNGGIFGALDNAASTAQTFNPVSQIDSSLNQSIEEIKSKFTNFELNMQNILQRMELLEYKFRDLERGMR